MARTSKLLSKEIVLFAEDSLKRIGKTGSVAIKLRAIIAAEKHGITHVAKIFGTTKASIIAWIKQAKTGSLDLLNVKVGRGRKSPLSEAQEKTIRKWLEEDSQLTIDRVKQKIMSEFWLEISRSSVHRIIKKLRFSYITARPKHYKQNSESLLEAKKKSNPKNTRASIK